MNIIGIDTGGTSTRIWDGKEPVNKISTPYEYNEYISILSQELAKFQPIDSLVISLPAVIENQVVIKIPNLAPSWKGKSLVKDIEEKLNIKKIIIIQDTEAAGYAIQHDELGDLDPTLFLTLSTGVGGALVTKDFVRPLEVGHMILNLSNENRVCGCGQVGCVEADLSGPSIFKRTSKKSEELQDITFWEKYGKELGAFLLDLIALFKLKQIVLAGGVSERQNLFLPQAKQYITRRLKNLEAPVINSSQAGDNAGVYGAYYFAMQNTM